PDRAGEHRRARRHGARAAPERARAAGARPPRLRAVLMAGKLRLGVIGAGSWAVASHLPNFARRRDEVEFVAVARKGDELLRKIRDDWGFAVASEDYRDVVAAGIDVCLVSSPTAFHHEHAKA